MTSRLLAAALAALMLAAPAVAERVTGYVVGGISPLGGRRKLPVFVDTSAVGQATICVSAGQRGLQIELASADWLRLTAATTVTLVAG